jgi:hypothetical protein
MYAPNDPVPKYVINFDEFVKLLGDDIVKAIYDALNGKFPQVSFNNLAALLEEIKSLLPYEKYRAIAHNIDLIINNSTIEGAQKIDGKLIDIPPIIQKISETFKFEKDIYITGFNINQTGWKKNDYYNLIVDRKTLIKESYTKEVGEHKYFNTFFPVPANTPITFVLNNQSGNSRQTMIDLEYIQKPDPPPPPPPPNPPPNPGGVGIGDITNDWDIAVVMDWEDNSVADIDLHGFLYQGETLKYHTWYGEPTHDDFFLNFDFRTHMNITDPEIISIKGYTGCVLKVYIHNYTATPLSKPVNVKIYHKSSTGNTGLLLSQDISLAGDNSYLKGVCTITLGDNPDIDSSILNLTIPDNF